MAEKEKYYIPVEGKLIEVEKDVYVTYYKMGRRERYLEERDRNNGVLSYDALDNDGIVGEEMFKDPKLNSLEDLALTKEIEEQLHRCIALLPRAERELIQAIYFEGMSDREYAKRIQKSQPAVSSKHRKILSKLKMFLNIMGDFEGKPFRNYKSSGEY